MINQQMIIADDCPLVTLMEAGDIRVIILYGQMRYHELMSQANGYIFLRDLGHGVR